jgi:hypothetical protein
MMMSSYNQWCHRAEFPGSDAKPIAFSRAPLRWPRQSERFSAGKRSGLVGQTKLVEILRVMVFHACRCSTLAHVTIVVLSVSC